jgi:hypothetical protein
VAARALVCALQCKIVRLRQIHRNRSNPDPFKPYVFKPYVFKPHLFKPLSPETIKARRAKSIDAASMCPNEENLSQCNNKINRKLSSPSGAVTNPK